jgi:hypothetical protein
MIFHKKKIRLETNKFKFGINNIEQIESRKRSEIFFSDINNYKELSHLSKNDSLSTLSFFNDSEELACFFVLTQLKKRRGIKFRTHFEELIKLSKSSISSIKKVLYFLEEISVLTISTDTIFEIEYRNE